MGRLMLSFILCVLWGLFCSVILGVNVTDGFGSASLCIGGAFLIGSVLGLLPEKAEGR